MLNHFYPFQNRTLNLVLCAFNDITFFGTLVLSVESKTKGLQ